MLLCGAPENAEPEIQRQKCAQPWIHRAPHAACNDERHRFQSIDHISARRFVTFVQIAEHMLPARGRHEQAHDAANYFWRAGFHFPDHIPAPHTSSTASQMRRAAMTESRNARSPSVS